MPRSARAARSDWPSQAVGHARIRTDALIRGQYAAVFCFLVGLIAFFIARVTITDTPSIAEHLRNQFVRQAPPWRGRSSPSMMALANSQRGRVRSGELGRFELDN